MATHEEVKATLTRDLSLFDIMMIGVGGMIGAGIFVLAGIAAGEAGPALLLAFILNGVVTLFTAASYAELGVAFPGAGGGYPWVRDGLNNYFGFLAGWMDWFAHSVACSLYSLGFGSFAARLLHMAQVSLFDLPEQTMAVILAVAAAALFTYINYRGASETGKIGNLVTIAKVLILAVLVAFGIGALIMRADWASEFTPFMPEGFSGVLIAMGLTAIAFQGYEIIAQSGEEVLDPERNIPRVSFAMGRNRDLPGFFGQIHLPRHTPHWAILLSGVLVILMAVLLPIEDVTSAADIMFMLMFMMVNFTLIVLRPSWACGTDASSSSRGSRSWSRRSRRRSSTMSRSTR